MRDASRSKSAAVRSRLGHPIIDSDGHLIEVLPVLIDLVEQVGGANVARKMQSYVERQTWADMSPDELRDKRPTVRTWWLVPSRNTVDRATASLPRLLAERMDDLGLDFSVLFPSSGLAFVRIQDEELRRACCRAYNLYVKEVYGPYSQRMTPAAAIPMHTPKEAIEELEFAVNTLGLKAAMIAGWIRRPIPAVHRNSSGVQDPHGTWIDAFGADSEYDYDPFWAKCIELGVAPASHSAGFEFTTNSATTFFMQNHLGHFAAAGQTLCKSLFFGGVTYRFPALRLAVLECGVGWAADLYAGIISRWEKRNPKALRDLDPAAVDADALIDLFARYGDQQVQGKLAEIRDSLTRPTIGMDKGPSNIDDWSLTRIEKPEDIRDRFVPNFFFGCEADDRMNSVAFNTRLNPFGARLGAILSSDIGHWDVPNMRTVVGEAYELVEEGLITDEDFHDFAFANPVRLFGGMNPEFFKGTVVERDVEKLLSGLRP